MEAITYAEGSILLWIQNNLRPDFASVVMKAITYLGDGGALWILVTLALLAFRRTRRLGMMCAISMIIGLVVTNLVLKNWVARVRPYEAIPGLERLVGIQKDFSFPSGHATNSFACGWVLFRRAPRRYGVIALVMAILISLSRLYVSVHYPTDVMAGILIGMASSILAMGLMPKLEQRFPAIGRLF